MVLSDSEVQSAPPTPRPPQPVSAPPSQIHIHSPSPARSPLASPVRKAVAGVKGYLEEEVGGHVTRLADPRDAWLPVTESRSGNAYYAAFHSLSSGIGFQALVLPTAFASLGWCVRAFMSICSLLLPAGGSDVCFLQDVGDHLPDAGVRVAALHAVAARQAPRACRRRHPLQPLHAPRHHRLRCVSLINHADMILSFFFLSVFAYGGKAHAQSLAHA
jgi:hypothetical protein